MIVVNLDVMMAKRKMSLSQLSEKVDITLANLSILKNNKAKAVRFSTLEAICAALADGTADLIATDHAPHTAEEKQNGAAGMVGLETAFAICYTKLCLQCGLPLQQLAELMSTNGAAILGLQNKGKLEIGYDADIALVDLAEQWTVHNEALHSKSKNSPYEGVQLTGKVKYTFRNGRMTWKDQ